METIRCINCDKVIKGQSHMVLMRLDQRLFAEGFEYAVSAAQDQGWFPVGPDCYKRVRKAGGCGLERK